MKTNIIRIQSQIRTFLSKNSDIYSVLKKNNVQQIFEDEISGYHMTSKNPLKESMWEEINANIMRSFCLVSEEAHGNHKSGIDNKFGDWKISNKTAKIGNNKRLDISSYRLTAVSKTDDIKKIVGEILKRDASYDYYSILIRNELSENDLKYTWVLVPKEYYTFNPKKYKWMHKIGRAGKVTGWKSNYMDITDSMSSQLWFHMNFTDIERFVVASSRVNVSNKISFAAQVKKIREQEQEIIRLKKRISSKKNE